MTAANGSSDGLKAKPSAPAWGKTWRGSRVVEAGHETVDLPASATIVPTPHQRGVANR